MSKILNISALASDKIKLPLLVVLEIVLKLYKSLS